MAMVCKFALHEELVEVLPYFSFIFGFQWSYSIELINNKYSGGETILGIILAGIAYAICWLLIPYAVFTFIN
jgi:hypothetical protein